MQYYYSRLVLFSVVAQWILYFFSSLPITQLYQEKLIKNRLDCLLFLPREIRKMRCLGAGIGNNNRYLWEAVPEAAIDRGKTCFRESCCGLFTELRNKSVYCSTDNKNCLWNQNLNPLGLAKDFSKYYVRTVFSVEKKLENTMSVAVLMANCIQFDWIFLMSVVHISRKCSNGLLDAATHFKTVIQCVAEFSPRTLQYP